MRSSLLHIKNNIKKYIELNDREFDFFAHLLQEKELVKKEMLLYEGEVCNYTSFVHLGCLRTFTHDKDGVEHILQFMPEDYWAGDLYSFLTGNPTNYNIEALETTAILQIHRNDMELVYHEIPKFERFFRILIQHSYVELQQRLLHSHSLSASEKHEKLIQKHKNIEQRVSQKHIASYLGITPESLSRLKRKGHQKSTKKVSKK